MISLRRVSKSYRHNGRAQCIADAVTATFPRGVSVALLGRNGAGKSTLLRMIAGTLAPDRGRILRRGSVSWPVGYSGGFHPDLTGAQNIRFVARLYGVDTDALCDFVAGFADLGAQFHAPVRSYSSGMRARLSFGLSLGIDFDTYLVDEVTAVGDAAFKSRSELLFAERLSRRGAIIVTHSARQARALCRAGAVLENGHLRWFDDVEAALDAHAANLRGTGGAPLQTAVGAAPGNRTGGAAPTG